MMTQKAFRALLDQLQVRYHFTKHWPSKLGFTPRLLLTSVRTAIRQPGNYPFSSYPALVLYRWSSKEDGSVWQKILPWKEIQQALAPRYVLQPISVNQRVIAPIPAKQAPLFRLNNDRVAIVYGFVKDGKPWLVPPKYAELFPLAEPVLAVRTVGWLLKINRLYGHPHQISQWDAWQLPISEPLATPEQFCRWSNQLLPIPKELQNLPNSKYWQALALWSI